MGKRHSIAEARSSLPRLVREAESGKPVELTRRGEPVAVLVGRQHYMRLTSGRRKFSEAYGEFTQQVNLEELGIDPDAVFAGARDRTPGRDVDL